jgi:drug/metabolite transporter (DMT)-like permease
MIRSARVHPAPSTPADRLSAIALMVLACSFFTALDTSAKYLATVMDIPVAQIVWCRFVVQFVGLAVLLPATGTMSLPAMMRTSKLTLQLARSVLMVLTTLFNFLALQYLRLDQTVTITFLAPLMVALLAGPFLGEWVGWRRFVAILVGFGGVLIAVRPGFGGVHPAVLYSIAGMVAYALFMILTRYLAAYDPPFVTLFYSMFAGTLFAAPVALAQWVTPADLTTWLLLAVLGVLGGTGHYLFLHAYRLAPASSISPFLYLQLLTMVAAGWLVFSDLPDAWTLVGSAVIIASGIYLVNRERMTAKTPVEPVPPAS